jgi:two-component sensor histidine kinase
VLGIVDVSRTLPLALLARTGQSIYWHLSAFALGLATPILVLVALVGWRYVEQEQRKFEEQSQRLVQDVAAAIDGDLAGFRATLDILATFPQLISGDLVQFYEHLKSATLAGGDGWIIVRRSDGQLLLHTRIPYGTDLPRFSDSEIDTAVFAERKSIVSNVLRGPTTGRWVVALSAPVVNERKEVPYAVQLIVPAEYFESVLRQQQSPNSWVLTINDRQGRILARSLNHTEWVGKPMAPQGWDITKDVPRGQSGIWRNVKTLEGRAVEGGYYRMISTGWLVGAAAPSEVYNAARRQAFFLIGAVTIILLATSATLGAYFGRRLIEAINVLKGEAIALRQGRVPTLPSTALLEANEVASVMRETTEILQQRDEHQQLLLQELNHRVKNTLATVQSLARRTFKGDGSGRYERFEGRLLSLSKTHDLLTASEWQGAKLIDIVEAELAPYKGHFRYDGPELFLPTRAALGLSMIFHELGTNAAKHGAFSTALGQVAIECSVQGNELRLEWVESCGPVVQPLKTQGFGSLLIRQTVERELQGTVSLVYHSTGVQCSIVLPLERDEMTRAA